MISHPEDKNTVVKTTFRRIAKMEITDIKIRRMEDNDRMPAVVSVVLDGELALHDIKVICAGGKTFLAMPAKKSPDGQFRDIVHPVTQEMREKLEKAIFSAYSE